MKRRLFNLVAILSLLTCGSTAGMFFLGGLLSPPAPRSWVLSLPNGDQLYFNRDEAMLQRSDGHGGFPDLFEVFYMWIAIPTAIPPIWWLIDWINRRDRSGNRSGFPVVGQRGPDH